MKRLVASVPSMNKRCSKCKKLKSLTDFSPMRACSDGHRGTCKKCATAFTTAWQQKRKQTLWGRLKFTLARCKARARMRGEAVDIELDYLMELYQRQEDRCAISGLKFHLDPPAPRPSPYSPSIDRVDSRRGYIQGNVQFVLFAINVAKGEWDVQELLPIWRAALKKARAVASKGFEPSTIGI